MVKEKENIMRKVMIEKVILNVGGTGDNLEKGFKLIKLISERTPVKTKSKKKNS